MVRLDSVRSEHGCHGGRVLSHQIVSEGILDFMLLLVVPVLALFNFVITLLLGKLEVLLLCGLEYCSALSLMIFLSLLENLIKMNSLLIICSNIDD